MAAALPIIYGATALIGAGSAAYGAYKMTQTDIPDPKPPPPMPPIEEPRINPEEEARKRFGRQKTILTSALTDKPVFKPTLLGQ